MRLIDADALEDQIWDLFEHYRHGMGKDHIFDVRNNVLDTVSLMPTEPTVSRWIACADKLPPKGEAVLAYKKSDNPVHAAIFIASHYADEIATHWMPLPAPPGDAT